MRNGQSIVHQVDKLLRVMWTVAILLLGCGGAFASANVLDDIRNAFKAVTNDTELLNHIIPEMYGSTMSNANPCFVFKMPTQRTAGSSDGFEMLTMQRSDFAEPIFPNITQSPTVIDSTPLVKTSTNVRTSPPAEWQQLGLEGWAGVLTPAAEWAEQQHKDSQAISWQTTVHTRDDILLDLKGQQLDGRVKDIRVIAADNSQQAALQELRRSENVYIGRVNDPFGYSMKWSMVGQNVTQQPASDNRSSIASNDVRGKRDVAKLYSMIKCSTGCDPLIYKGYGCYCGFGGQGVPVDGIDRCCRLHDKCYTNSNCISYLEYFVPYVWKCYNGKPLCAIDHGEWGGPDSCAARLCQCDLRLSRCLRKFYCPRRRTICYSSRARRLQNFLFYD